MRLITKLDTPGKVTNWLETCGHPHKLIKRNNYMYAACQCNYYGDLLISSMLCFVGIYFYYSWHAANNGKTSIVAKLGTKLLV